MTDRKLLLVGWDAADWRVIRPLMAEGRMPNVRKLVEGGMSGNLRTLSPALSPMLWTSIATGKRPYKHGIHGFTEPTPDRKSVQPITNLSRKSKAIWNILNQNGKRSLVVGWWPSHPAEPIDGVMISNQYQRAPKDPTAPWPMKEGTVHPPELAEAMAELRFHPGEVEPAELLAFVPDAASIDQDKDHRLDGLARIFADATSIHCAATELLETQEWDFAAVYFDAIDHFGHGFMRFHPPKQDTVSQEDFELYRGVVSTGYIYHDMMLGRLIELAGTEATVLLISDHGFHPDEHRPQAIPSEPAGPAAEHREQGIVALRGVGIRAGGRLDGASLLDVAPTILTHFGLPVGEDMDGRPLVDAWQAQPKVETVPSWDEIPGKDGCHPPDLEISPEAARESLNQLVDLGYIDPLSEDAGEAVRHTERELNFNLAQAYMDGGMHVRAAEILAELYREYPLEFRFGLQLALCLHATNRPDLMEKVVAHLDSTWRLAATAARERIAAFGKDVQARKMARDEAAHTNEAAELPNGQPGVADTSPLVSPGEARVLRQLKGIARGNPLTIDYLFSSIAVARGDHQAALAHLENTREAALGMPDFHLQLGRSQLPLGRLDEAKESFRTAIGLDPENADAHLGLAQVALKEQQPEEALEFARVSLGLKYHAPFAHFVHGQALYLCDRAADAVTAMETAIALNPNFPQAYRRLSEIHSTRIPDAARAKRYREMADELTELSSRLARPSGLKLSILEEPEIEARLPAFPDPPNQSYLVPLAAKPATVSRKPGPPVTIVSGLPRSGTSMAMQMLVAGGLEALTDDVRKSDDNNPRGYWEYEPVKRLMRSNDWIHEARGKVLKVVVPLVPCLPQALDYRVVLMERPGPEIVRSQSRMLKRLEKSGGNMGPEDLSEALRQQSVLAEQILSAHSVPTLRLRYPDVVNAPQDAAQKIARFLGLELDVEAMVEVVSPELWRERC